jgi:hypothetical protein
MDAGASLPPSLTSVLGGSTLQTNEIDVSCNNFSWTPTSQHPFGNDLQLYATPFVVEVPTASLTMNLPVSPIRKSSAGIYQSNKSKSIRVQAKTQRKQARVHRYSCELCHKTFERSYNRDTHKRKRKYTGKTFMNRTPNRFMLS